MSSRCLKVFVALAGALTTLAFYSDACADEHGSSATTRIAGQTSELRVCADPDNLPYSHQDQSGFENRIARLVAAELHARLTYFWLPQRRAFVRKSLGQNKCDLFIGVPAGFKQLLTTKPYYRSSYVFVARSADPVPLRSFEDMRLANLRIGVQLPGEDLAATPPGYALARRGAIENVVGYTVYGAGPAAQRVVQALERDQLDAALIWGPQAGYFARRSAIALTVTIAHAPSDLPMPFEFAIAMGVRKDASELRDALDAVIEKHRGEIDTILARYGVPRTDRTSTTPEVSW